ncbi:MAG: hypothetical protein ACRC8P_01695 [Spiroplasma sp.]
MARNVYKVNKNKLSNNKSELDSKTDSVVLTNFKVIEEDAFVEEMKENNAESVYKLSNNKSELDSKTDSVVLTNFKAIEEDAFVEEMKETQEKENLDQEKENQSSDCCSILRKKQKSLNLIINSFRKGFHRLTAENSKLGQEISFLNADIETLITEQKEWDRNIERVVTVIEQQRKERNMYEVKIKTMKKKIELKQPEIESESEFGDERLI